MNIKTIFALSFLFTSLCFGALDLTLPIKKVRAQGITEGTLAKLPTLRTLQNSTVRKWLKSEVDTTVSDLYLTGFFKQVRAETISSNNLHTLVFTLEENPMALDIRFSGNTQFSTDLLSQKMVSKKGEHYQLKNLAQDIRNLEDFYHTNGFDFMRVESVTTHDGVLFFTLSEGTLSSFSIEGLATIEPRVAYREFRSNKQSIFNSKFLREDREKLLRLGYFSDISYPKLQNYNPSTNAVGVILQLKEQKVNILDIGIEQARQSASGQELNQLVLFVKNNWNHVFINSDILSAKVQYGNDYDNQLKITSYSLKYTQPWTLNQYPFSTDMELWEEYRDELAGRDPSTQVIVKNRRLGQQLSLSFPLVADRFTMVTRAKNENIIPLESLGGTQPYSLRALSVQWIYRDYTSISNPKWGQFFGLELEKGGNLGGVKVGGINYSRVSLSATQFLPLSDPLTLGLHGFAGIFDAPDLTFSTFETEAFTLGGANSLRGYKESEALIGSHKILLNSELRYNFSPDFQGILFYDIGRVFDTGSFISRQGIRSGRGFGLRFFTPIAPIRFDFSWGDDAGLIIHFGLGQVF